MLNKVMQHWGEERSVIREIFEYGNCRKREIGAENVFDFSIGNPSVPAPQIVSDTIARLTAEMPPEALHGYSSAAGVPDVRRAVAKYIEREFGAPMSEEFVYMTCGAAASLAIVLNALYEAGDEVVALAPFFPEYRTFVEHAGAKLVIANTDARFHIDIGELDRVIGPHTKAVILNSPNNPTGAVYGEDELIALSELLTKKSAERGKPVFLIADEPYRELVYGTSVPYPAKYYKNTLTCYSFSKSLSLPGERIGYIAVSPSCTRADELFSAVCGAGRALGYICAPVLFQRVCAECLGMSSDVSVYEKNRDLLFEALTSYGYECAPPEGAFYLFVKSPEPDAKKFCERAKKYELLLVPSDSFGCEGYVRISYCVAPSVIERSLPAFKKLIEEYR